MVENKHELNGTRLFTFTNNNLNSFCISLYIKAGCIYENADDNGIAHLFEHIVFRNLKKKYPKFYETLAMNGLYFEGCTYKEFIRFSVEGIPSGLDFAIEILCGIFDEINISKSEFDFEKSRIKAEIREDDIKNTVEYLFSKNVWKETNCDKTVTGNCKILDKTNLDKLNNYRESILSNQNCFFYATGNITDKKIELLKTKISKLNISKINLEYKNEIQISPDFFNRDGLAAFKNGYYNYIQMGFDVDTQRCRGGVLDIIYSVLFNGDSSLVHTYLSENEPIIYSFDSVFEQYDNVGNINFRFEINADKAEQAIIRVLRLLQDIKNGNFNFEANLASEVANNILILDNPNRLNWNLAYYNHILKTEAFDYSKKDLGRFSGITKEMVIDTANEIFCKKNLTVAVKGEKMKSKIKCIETLLKKL